eukprot:GEMP01000239.1.p1 GENE.GEMP01000239.1~~GEMP01000239.1.p1  ORF type:complete len:2215 (-),score=593.78 GEMP01000239.1:1467-8111(-)
MIDIGCTSEPWEGDVISQIHSVSDRGGVVLIDNNTSNFTCCVSKVSAAVIGYGTKVYIKGDPRVVSTLSEHLKRHAGSSMTIHGEGDSECFAFNVSIDIVSHLISYFKVTGAGSKHFGFYGICGFDMVKMTEKELRSSVEADEKNLVLFLPTEVCTAGDRDGERISFTFDGEQPEPIDIAAIMAPFARTTLPIPDNSIPYEKLVANTVPQFLMGNMTECVLSREQVLRSDKTPGALFIDLINLNRSEYCLLCTFGGEATVVSSPEMFVKVTGRVVESYPIAGTIRRGATPEEDAANEQTLIDSFKDRIELAMCTDVDRNDKSRICMPNSIRVLEERLIKKYSHVMHTVDHVGGILRPELTSMDAFKAQMWAVTVTGSPRLNALRYIAQHETSRRKWYSGAGGVFRANGDIITCILIRFIHMIANGSVSIRSGASLIHLSDPAEETNEISIKAAGMIRALSLPSSSTITWMDSTHPNATTCHHDASAISTLRVPRALKVPFTGKIVVVDYEDSFVNTVAYYLRSLITHVDVIRYNLVDWAKLLEDPELSLVVLSPGPGSPSEYDVPKNAMRLRAKGIPILGVCLGFQGLMEADGVSIEVIPEPRHGYQRVNTKAEDGWLWADIPAGHYHSLGVTSIPDSYTELCRDGDYITGVQHKTEAIIAWQFHPESNLTAPGVGHKIFLHSLRHLLNHNKPERWVFTSPANRTTTSANADFIDDLLEMEETGLVDAIEIGIPYTDPIADGPIIQRAYQEALAQVPNISVRDVVDLVARARVRGFGLPVVIMGYLNTFFTHSADCGFTPRHEWVVVGRTCGIKHVIIVDADVDTVLRHDLVRKLEGIKLIPVISEILDAATCEKLCASTDYDIVYCTNYLGTTGGDASRTKHLCTPYMEHIRRIRASGKSILAGFGIKNSADIDKVRQQMGCDMVVVGSQYLKLLQQGKTVSDALQSIFSGVSASPLSPVVKKERATDVEDAAGASKAACVGLKVCGFGHPNEVIAAGMERVQYFGFLLEPELKRTVQPALLERCFAALDKIKCQQYQPESCAIFRVESFADWSEKTAKLDRRFDIVQVFFKMADMGEIRQIINAVPSTTPFKWIMSLSNTEMTDSLWDFLQSSENVWAVSIDQKEGGAGIMWDYASVFAQLPASFKKPLFLGGGVNVDNVQSAVASIRAQSCNVLIVMDVATGSCDDSGVRKSVSNMRTLARACFPLPLYYGPFGGAFVPQTIFSATRELTQCYSACLQDPSFFATVTSMFAEVANRPTLLYEAKNLTRKNGGAKIWLKREDLLHTGAHKINNAIYQMIIARRMGKTRIIAETGAGQHGVAVATVCAQAGMKAVIYMGADDVARQNLNVRRINFLGSEVVSCDEGDKTLGSAINAAMRDWVENIRETHYIIGSALGPAPFPVIVRDAQAIIGREARAQFLDKVGVLPNAVIACVGGGSNAIGMFDAFTADHNVQLIGVEAGGTGPKNNAQTLMYGSQGVLHGSINTILQDVRSGQTIGSHSVSAGLDYPGVSPIHCYLKHTGRCEYRHASDGEAIDALITLSETEGILPALESSHAVAAALEMAKTLASEDNVVVCLSGRGDKDMGILQDYMNAKENADRMTQLCTYLTDTYGRAPMPRDEVILRILENLYSDEDMFRLFDAFQEAATNEAIPVEHPAHVLTVLREEILSTHPYKILNGGNCIDIVGTGGDGKNPYNISSPASIVAASVLDGGMKVVKHGNSGFSSSSGCADFLAELGFNLDLDANLHALLHKGHPFAFVVARQLHHSFGRFARVRKLYQRRTLFNFLGPLVNPFASYTVTGVAVRRMGFVYAKVLEGKMSGIIVHSDDGVDKISPHVPTTVWRIRKNAQTTMETIDPHTALGSAATADYLAMPEGICALQLNPRKFVGLLHGEAEDDYAKYVIINAAAVLWVSGSVTDLAAGVGKIREALQSGVARAFFYEAMYLSHHCGNKQGILNSIQKWVSFRPLRAPPADETMMKPRSFSACIGACGLFAEAKTRSPDFPSSPHSFESMVDLMVAQNTTVISVLSDPIFFGGSLEQLRLARLRAGENGPLILRKDFILSTASIDESFQWGADTVLLIVRMYKSDQELQTLVNHTRKWGTEPLVEVASEAELDSAMACNAKVIGINNRDLVTFVMDKTKSIRLAKILRDKYPEQAKDTKIIVLSGVSGSEDIEMYKEAGMSHFLVGTLFGKSSNLVEACQALQSAIEK